MPVTASAVIAGAQGVMGVVQAASGAARSKRLRQQRQAYVTPKEFEKILQATQAGMNDPRSLNYGTQQIDRSFSSFLGSAERLGADPNQLSAMFDQKIQGLMKVGEQNHLQNLQSFNKYLSALDVMGKSDEAGQASRDNMLKDQLQSAAADKAAGMQNIGSALNAGIGTASAAQTANLYKMQQQNSLPNTIRQAASPIQSLSTIPAQDASIANSVLPNPNAGVIPQGLLPQDMYGNYTPYSTGARGFGELLTDATSVLMRRR